MMRLFLLVGLGKFLFLKPIKLQNNYHLFGSYGLHVLRMYIFVWYEGILPVSVVVLEISKRNQIVVVTKVKPFRCSNRN